MTANLKYAFVFSLLAIAGCGGSPRLDATNEATLEASKKKMTAEMSDAQKRQFASDLQAALGPEARAAIMKNTFSKDKDKAPASAAYKSLNGMNAEDIHAQAEQNRPKKK